MAANYSYDKLATNQESQDISEVMLRPLSFPTHTSYSSVDQRNVTDFASVKSFSTFSSSTGSSSIGKLKSLGNRIRRKPLPRYLNGSIRRHPAAEIEPTRVGRGVWKDQLLVDRSLRTMAATMTAFAIAMIILIATYATHFNGRPNPNTTSVGGDNTRSCKDVTKTNTALLLLINVCATMVLGMSNTYQQLVTSLKISDLKFVLSKFGDSRVGTNSPFSINHKQSGKKRAWCAWLLLILTSMPVHFLANSLIGPSFIQQLPDVIEFKEVANATSQKLVASFLGNEERIRDEMSFPCWSAFRTGTPHYPKSTDIFNSNGGIFGSSQNQFGTTWKRMQIHYASGNCSQHARTATDVPALEGKVVRSRYYTTQYAEGNCFMGDSIYCTLHDPQPAECRLNVRMSAAFILVSCLVIKAAYMCAVNLLARGKLKTHCLTFGDVIVASASHTELRVQGYEML
ncbi:uncharacterized protein K460DRAFT_272419 [Cucurbitaria berberidis CBS 394.84]|uniref:DUF6536 domain-containing protein n=1 Tax=Cucurbitaria berberidis CBS 394.84 TaxID=1168544 RepID=A0A9P4LD21_9PLEO|nr:uncharacterized protein K460DRAFT_272419 [Cucurbitaria berberidis CBS 394.84]KAF1851391.1 hypothetical protein K460DRAFT_272419 [Cucurbitaria berberidis CBS 394.84]